jgi:hypothetical protein
MRLGIIFGLVLAVILAVILWNRASRPFPDAPRAGLHTRGRDFASRFVTTKYRKETPPRYEKGRREPQPAL